MNARKMKKEVEAVKQALSRCLTEFQYTIDDVNDVCITVHIYGNRMPMKVLSVLQEIGTIDEIRTHTYLVDGIKYPLFCIDIKTKR